MNENDVLRVVDFVVASVERLRGPLGVRELGEVVAAVDLVCRGYREKGSDVGGAVASGVIVSGRCGREANGEDVGTGDAADSAAVLRGDDAGRTRGSGARVNGDAGVVGARGLVFELVGEAQGRNYARNKRNRERRRLKKAGSVNGVGCVKAVSESAGVAAVDAEQAKRLAKQLASLYELRNERELLKLRREIEMEKATQEAGANVARVDNWIAEIKSGKSKSSGTSRGSTGSGRFTKRSAWSGGSWRVRSVGSDGSSVVPEEVHEAVLSRNKELEAKLVAMEKEKRDLAGRLEHAKDRRYEALNHQFRIYDRRADVGMVTAADKAEYEKKKKERETEFC